MTITAPTNTALILDDGAITYAPTGGGTFTRKGTVGGVARVYDTGSATVPATFVAAFQASVLDRTTGNEQYVLNIEAAKNLTFAGEVRSLGSWSMSVQGQQDVIGISTLDPLDNTVWRYLRLSIQVSGTTPQIAVSAFLRPLSDLTPFTYAELIQLQVFTLENILKATGCWISWANGVAWGGDNADGKYPIYDGYGHAVYRKCPAQLEAESQGTGPLSYGAIGDGNSHKASLFYPTLAALQIKYPQAVSLDQEMDWLGIQAWFNAGGGVSSRRAYKVFNNNGDPQIPLTAIAGVVDPDFGYSWLDCTALTPLTTPQWVTSQPTFAAGTGWYNATGYSADALIPATFNTGEAVLFDIGYTTGTTPNSYFEFKRFESLAAGQYECTATIISTKGGSYDRLNPNPPYLNIRFNASGAPGENVPTGSAAAVLTGILTNDITQTIRFFINLTAPGSGLMTMRAGGYASHRVTQFGVKKVAKNCAIWTTRDGSPENYPPAIPFKRMRMRGPGRGIAGSRGIWWQSFVTKDGTVMGTQDCDIRGFERACEYGNGAYLVEHRFTKLIGNTWNHYFPTGNENAGENIRSYGGECVSADILVYNPGAAEFTFDQTALDYPDSQTANNGQLYKGRGKLTLKGIHVEVRPTTVIGKPLVDIDGILSTIGCKIMMSSPLAGCVEPPIHLASSHAMWSHHDTEPYNLTDVNGIMCSGPGRIVGTFLNPAGNPNIGKLLSRAPVMDILGGAGKFLDTDSWGDVGKKASAQGLFTGIGSNGDTFTIGSRVYTRVTTLTGPDQFVGGVSAATAAVNLTNAVNAGPGAGTTYGTGTVAHADVTAANNNGKLIITAKSNGALGNLIALAESSAAFSWPSATLTGGKENISLEGGCYPYAGSTATSQWAGDNYSLIRTDDYSYNDSKALKFTKAAPGNTVGARIRFQFRVDQAANIMGLWQLLAPHNVGTGTAELYYEMYWVQCTGYDSLGRPIWGQKRLYKGRGNELLPLAGSPVPVEKRFSSLYAEPSTDESASISTGAPDWATHFGWYVDTQSLPVMDFYMLDMIANRV